MSDTITPEERARLRSVLSEHGNPQVEDRIILRLLNTAEQAEASAERLTKMVDFMAQQMADVYSTDEDGRYTLTCPARTLRAADHDCDKISCPQCWKEAASRAVADDSEVKG